MEGDLLGERRGRCTTSAPPTTSEWPPQYFVVECTTTSAPRVSGCWRYGEAKVLSTTSSAPASCATAASASMSPMLSSGLVGVSTQTSRGLAGPDRGAHRVHVGDRRRGVREAPRLLDLGEQPVGAAVRVVGDDHVVAGRAERLQQGVLGGQAAGEREARARPPRARRWCASSAVRVGFALREYS